jgi:hypothetical protein
VALSQIAAPASAAQTARALDPFLKGIAMALSSPDLRRQVLEDLRDSPFPKHKLHLQSYLGSARGRTIATAAGRAIGVSLEQFLATLDGLPSLEFSVSRSIDRVRWTGTDDVVVVGSAADLTDILRAGRLSGYNVRGESVTMPVMSAFNATPQIHVLKAQASFGTDPEARRSAAPRKSGNTISTRQEEFLAVQECDPMTAIIECNTETGGGGTGTTNPGGYLLDPSYSWDNCVTHNNGLDRDLDNIGDECEYQIAYAFRPYLKIMSNDNNSSREPHWSVTRSLDYPRTFRIFYALSYREDGGSPALGQATSHNGDSEFIIVEVQEIAHRSVRYGSEYAFGTPGGVLWSGWHWYLGVPGLPVREQRVPRAPGHLGRRRQARQLQDPKPMRPRCQLDRQLRPPAIWLPNGRGTIQR